MPLVYGPCGDSTGGPAYIAALRARRLLPTVRSATSSWGSLLPTNLADYIHPQRIWRANQITEQRVVLTLAESTNIGAVFFGWLDPGGANGISQVSLEANDEDAWESPSFSLSLPLSDLLNPLTGRYQYAYVPDPNVPLLYRYVSLRFPAHTGTPVGLGQFELFDTAGCFVSPRGSLEWGWTQGFLENELPNKSRERIAMGPRLLTVNFNWEMAYNYRDVTSLEVEDGLLEDQNLHTDVDDYVLVVRDCRFLSNYAVIGQAAAGGVQISSALGVGATIALSYQESC